MPAAAPHEPPPGTHLPLSGLLILIPALFLALLAQAPSSTLRRQEARGAARERVAGPEQGVELRAGALPAKVEIGSAGDGSEDEAEEEDPALARE